MNRLLVECLAQMAKVLLDQQRDTPATVVEAEGGVSESGDESTASHSVPPGCALVKQAVAQ